MMKLNMFINPERRGPCLLLLYGNYATTTYLVGDPIVPELRVLGALLIR